MPHWGREWNLCECAAPNAKGSPVVGCACCFYSSRDRCLDLKGRVGWDQAQRLPAWAGVQDPRVRDSGEVPPCAGCRVKGGELSLACRVAGQSSLSGLREEPSFPPSATWSPETAGDRVPEPREATLSGKVGFADVIREIVLHLGWVRNPLTSVPLRGEDRDMKQKAV